MKKPEIVIVTGLSGSGKTTVLKAFEDLEYLSMDNFPVRLVEEFLEESKENPWIRRIAFGMDLRDKYFLKEFPEKYKSLQKNYTVELLFLEAREEVIVCRYNQTRRKHPLCEKDVPLEKAIQKERELLKEIRGLANLVFDTSDFTVHTLRNKIFEIYGKRTSLKKMLVHILAFGFKYGVPAEVSYVFDLRWLPNPYFEDSLKESPGTCKEVKDFLMSSPTVQKYLEKIGKFLEFVLPEHIKEGRRYLTVGVGCTGGMHRAPAFADFLKEKISSLFAEEIDLTVTYRDLEKELARIKNKSS